MSAWNASGILRSNAHSLITNLSPANISAGTAGISITGNVATATNALTLNGHPSSDFQLSGNYARLDLPNTFVGNQVVAGNVTATGKVAAVSFTGNGAGLTGVTSTSSPMATRSHCSAMTLD